MRGRFADQGGLFSYISPEARVPASHPLRKIRELVRDVLSELNRSLGRLYASEGRPSIPPEQLLSALLLQVFYGIRSERQLMEQLDYNLLYRWFVSFVVTDNCIKCKYMDCVEVCPVDCFYEGENMLVIHPDECIDCGVCEPECPAEAISADTEPGLESWLKLNAEYASVWPNITIKREQPADAKAFDGVADKLKRTFLTQSWSRRLIKKGVSETGPLSAADCGASSKNPISNRLLRA